MSLEGIGNILYFFAEIILSSTLVWIPLFLWNKMPDPSKYKDENDLCNWTCPYGCFFCFWPFTFYSIMDYFFSPIPKYIRVWVYSIILIMDIIIIVKTIFFIKGLYTHLYPTWSTIIAKRTDGGYTTENKWYNSITGETVSTDSNPRPKEHTYKIDSPWEYKPSYTHNHSQTFTKWELESVGIYCFAIAIILASLIPIGAIENILNHVK